MLKYLAGWIAAIASIGLWQDRKGQEAMIQYTRDHWVDESISVPIEIGMIMLAVALLLIAFRRDRRKIDRVIKGSVWFALDYARSQGWEPRLSDEGGGADADR